MRLSTFVQQRRENRARTSWKFRSFDAPSAANRYSWHTDDISYTNRHWHSESEKYAGVDCLLSALDEGWIIDGIVFGEVHRFSSGCQTTVYHFPMIRNGTTMIMPVIENPYVAHLTDALTLQVIFVSDG